MAAQPITVPFVSFRPMERELDADLRAALPAQLQTDALMQAPFWGFDCIAVPAEVIPTKHIYLERGRYSATRKNP